MKALAMFAIGATLQTASMAVKLASYLTVLSSQWVEANQY
jgi:hypothetical protein